MCFHISLTYFVAHKFHRSKPLSLYHERQNGQKLVQQEKALEPITEKQQSFIGALLSGKNISEAARLAGISRRAGRPIGLPTLNTRYAWNMRDSG
jgi:hypothetical protein